VNFTFQALRPCSGSGPSTCCESSAQPSHGGVAKRQRGLLTGDCAQQYVTVHNCAQRNVVSAPFFHLSLKAGRGPGSFRGSDRRDRGEIKEGAVDNTTFCTVVCSCVHSDTAVHDCTQRNIALLCTQLCTVVSISPIAGAERGANLAQKLGQPQPFIAVLPRNTWADLHLLGQPKSVYGAPVLYAASTILYAAWILLPHAVTARRVPTLHTPRTPRFPIP
jgi:hypothetical protein